MPQTRSDTIAAEEPVSSPARPSHHNRVNPYAKASAQVRRNLKRTATTAALPSPPTTSRKRKHLETLPESDDDVQKTPTKSARAHRRTAASQSLEDATPKAQRSLRRGRSAANTGASPALVQRSARGRSRSPTPLDNDKPLPALSLMNRLSGAERQLAEDDQNEMSLTPVKRQRRVTAAPSSSSRQTRSSTRAVPIRDSPNNPFLNSTKLPRKKPSAVDQIPLHKRETIQMVYRGTKTTLPNFLRTNLPDRHLSPSDDDYSPSNEFVPKLLFPETSPTPLDRPRRGVTVNDRGSPIPFAQTAAKNSVARNLFGDEIARRNGSLKSTAK